MSKKKLYIFFSICFIFVFLISYEIYKSKFDFSLFSNDSVTTDIYYCKDSTYTLTKTSCIKYVATNPIIIGDVNGDLIVDIDDINIIKEYISNEKDLNTKELSSSDVNEDSFVDMNDIGLLQTYLLDKKGDIGVKKICDDDYDMVDNVCVKKVIIEAEKLDYIKGDINRDSKVDYIDKLVLEKYLKRDIYLTKISLKIADLDNDDKVTKDDLQALYKIIKNNKSKTNLKEEKYTESKVLDDLVVLSRTKQKLKSSYAIGSKIDHYFIFDTNKKYYYKYLNISDLETIEMSDCFKIENNILDYFQITIIKDENYGKINFYSDNNCSNLIGSYETKKYLKK